MVNKKIRTLAQKGTTKIEDFFFGLRFIFFFSVCSKHLVKIGICTLFITFMEPTGFDSMIKKYRAHEGLNTYSHKWPALNFSEALSFCRLLNSTMDCKYVVNVKFASVLMDFLVKEWLQSRQLMQISHQLFSNHRVVVHLSRRHFCFGYVIRDEIISNLKNFNFIFEIGN